MNRKLIAAAVSAAVIAPVAAQAESEFYGSIRNAIELNDITGDGTTDLSGVVSRLGFKGSSDIGNGMTVSGRYEFSATTDKEGDDDKGKRGIGDVRLAQVGISGGFGSVTLGQQWSSYFNTFGTLVSPTMSLGYYIYSSVGAGIVRTSNTIQYSNSFGPVSAYLDVRLDDDGSEDAQAEKVHGDGIGLGLSFAVTDGITVALAFDSEDGGDIAERTVADVNAEIGVANLAAIGTGVVTGIDVDDFVLASDDDATKVGTKLDATATKLNAAILSANGVDPGLEFAGPSAASTGADTDRVGIAVKATFGNFWGSIGHQTLEVDDDNDATDIDTSFLWGGGSLGDKTDWMVGYAIADDGDDDADVDDSEQLTWQITHKLGGGFRFFYEGVTVDATNPDGVIWDGDRHLLGMRIEF